jgi:hypothetical protein
MDTIVHLIRLHPDTDPAGFEDWVREIDYATCPELPSVLAFSVHRALAETPWHYYEVIQVTSIEDFERDMHLPAFKGLEEMFEKMATVTEEFSGRRLHPGYARGGSAPSFR